MTHNHIHNSIEKLLNLNLSIENNFFKKIKFKEHELEKAFLFEDNCLDEKLKIKSDLMIIVGWFSIFIYIYLVFNRPLYIYTCAILTFISLMLTCLRYFNKNREFKLIIDHVQVFLPIIYLNLKALYIIFFLASSDDDLDKEIIRTITYNWVSTTIFIIQKLDGRPWVYLFFTVLNFTIIIIIHSYSYNNHYYYLDAISSLIVAVGGYFLKRFNEMKIRIIYGEKIKNEKMSNFFFGFINGLNGCYLSFKNDNSISYGSNMKLEMESLNLNGYNQHPDINCVALNDEFKDSDQFIFLKSSTESNIHEKFLNSLIHYDEKLIKREKKLSQLINTEPNECLMLTIRKLQNNYIDSCLNFNNIGIYFIKTIDGYKYYDVYFRKINLTENNINYDLVFYKATDLIVSLIKIEEEIQTKNQILGKLVHEFKTPLNSILGLIENIKERENTDPIMVKHDLNIIKNLSNYVIFLINDIIHYSSNKKYDQLNIIMHEINIRKIVIFSFDILNSLLSCYDSKSQSIKTELEFQDDIYNLRINADETRLKQILLNIISNAVKFTKSGFIKLKCFKHPEKELLLLKIADSGSGIKDENQNYIFNDYFMESEGYKNNSYGTGIGLSICKNLANRMNMDIKFKSKLGKGTEFTIEIPSTSIINSSENDVNKNQYELLEKNDNSITLSLIKNSISLSSNINNANINMSHRSSKEKIYIKSYNQDISNSDNNDNFQILNPNKRNSSELQRFLPNIQDLSSNKLDKVGEVKKFLSNTYENTIFMYKNNQLNNQFLIVDDDKYICNSIEILVKRIFKETECSVDVITASDGVHIIQKIIEDQKNGNKIKCIITDENMEYLNGSEAIKILRNLEKDYKIKNVKIITATSQDDIVFSNKIKNIGADIVMSKPLSKITLTKALQELKILDI